MFSKAGIKRFNDVTSCAPSPASYNPKLPEVSSTGGMSFQKSNRFPTGPFAIPMTPMGSSTPDCRRHNGSGSRGNALSTLPRRMNKMCQARTSSTFSLPVTFDSNNYTPGDEEFAIHRGHLGSKDELESELQELHSELSRVREDLHSTEADRDTLRKRVEELKQDLVAAETRVVESEQTLTTVEFREREKGEKLMDLQSKIDTLEGSLVAAKHQSQVLQAKNEELQKEKEDLTTKDLQALTSQLDNEREKRLSLQAEYTRNLEAVQQKLVHFEQELINSRENLQVTEEVKQKLTSQLENEREKRLSLEAEYSRNLEAVQQKLVHFEQELINTRENLRVTEEVKQALCQHVEELKGQLYVSDCRVTEMENSLSLASTQLQTFQEKELKYQGQLSNVQEFLKASEEEKEVLQNQLQKFKQNFEQAEIRFTGLEKALEVAEVREKESEDKVALQDQIISTVNGKLIKAQTELITLETNNDLLQQTIDDLLSQNHSQALDLVQLNERLQESLRNTQELDARLSEESSKIIEIQNELKQAVSLAEHERGERAMSEEILKSELETTRGKADYLYSELVNLQEFSKRADDERASLRQLLKEYTLNLSTGASQILELQQSLACVESSEKEKDEKILKLECRVEEAESNLVLTYDNLNAFQMKNNEMMDTISELNTMNGTLFAQVTQLNEELHVSQNQYNELDAALVEQKSQLTKREQELQATLSLLQTLQSERIQVESQLKSELEATLEHVAQSESEIITTKDSLHKLEEEKECLRQQVEKFKVGSIGSEVQIVILEQSVVAATAQLEIFQKKDLHAQAELSHLRDILQNVEDERNLLMQDVEDTQKKLLATKCEVTKLREALVAAELSDQEKEDKLYCQQSRIEVIEDNLSEANYKMSHLQAQNGELQSLNADLQLKLTNQSVEVAQLKDYLDVRHCQFNEMQTRLDDVTTKFNEIQHELRQTLSLLENERNEHAATVGRLTSELGVSNQNLAEAVQNGSEWKDRYESAAEEKERHIQRLKMAESKLGEYLNAQIKAASQAADLNKSSTEVLVLQKSLGKLEEHAKSSKQKLAAIEIEMAKHVSSSENWKALHDKVNAEVQKTRAERIQFQETILRQDKQIKHLETQNAILEKLIGPFKEQLKVYKDSLDVEHDAAARQARYAQEIADKYADIVGHQNPKQRIHHMQKLKNDNLTLKNENSVLQKKLTQAQKRLEDLEERCSKSAYRRFDPRQAFKHQDAEDTQNIPPT